MPKALTDSHDTERWDANLEQMADEMEQGNTFKGLLIGLLIGTVIWAAVLGCLYLYWNRG